MDGELRKHGAAQILIRRAVYKLVSLSLAAGKHCTTKNETNNKKINSFPQCFCFCLSKKKGDITRVLMFCSGLLRNDKFPNTGARGKSKSLTARRQ